MIDKYYIVFVGAIFSDKNNIIIYSVNTKILKINK